MPRKGGSSGMGEKTRKARKRVMDKRFKKKPVDQQGSKKKWQ